MGRRNVVKASYNNAGFSSTHGRVATPQKCAFVFSLLTGRALDWATAVWETDPQVQISADYFMSLIREVFQYPAGGMDISTQLFNIRQGNMSAADYAIQFRTLAAQSGWNEVPLKAAYQAGLSHRLQRELTCRDEGMSLSQYITLSVRTDNLLRNSPLHSSENTASNLAMAATTVIPPPEPMQVGYTRLTPQERQRRFSARLCFYCGEASHVCANCPKRPSTRASRVSSCFSFPNPVMSLSVSVKVHIKGCTHVSAALIDSGAALNLIDHQLAQLWKLSCITCSPPLRITAVNGQPIGSGIRRMTQPLLLQVGVNHYEQVTFHVISSPHSPIILGFPWLTQHDPDIS
ncbi:MAG: hypothetical protein ACRC0X_03015, partial [Brevinema sp.]